MIYFCFELDVGGCLPLLLKSVLFLCRLSGMNKPKERSFEHEEPGLCAVTLSSVLSTSHSASLLFLQRFWILQMLDCAESAVCIVL